MNGIYGFNFMGFQGAVPIQSLEKTWKNLEKCLKNSNL